jgi:hypothetical protein
LRRPDMRTIYARLAVTALLYAVLVAIEALRLQA